MNVKGVVMTQYIQKGWSLRLSIENSDYEAQSVITRSLLSYEVGQLTATNVPGKKRAPSTARDFMAAESRLVAADIFCVVILSRCANRL